MTSSEIFNSKSTFFILEQKTAVQSKLAKILAGSFFTELWGVFLPNSTIPVHRPDNDEPLGTLADASSG